jgi:hypothetical protein
VVEELEYPSNPESYAVGNLANEFQLHCEKAGFTPVFRIITDDDVYSVANNQVVQGFLLKFGDGAQRFCNRAQQMFMLGPI